MEPRGAGKIIHWILSLAAAPVRAAWELVGLFITDDDSGLAPEQLMEKAHRRRSIFASLPAFLGLLVAIGIVGYNSSRRNRTTVGYTERLNRAIEETNAPIVKRVGLRVFSSGLSSLPSAAMDYCRYLANEKELSLANSIIEKLAPDDAPGYPPAHAQRAVAYSNLLSQGANERYLAILLWHLKQAGEPSTENLWMAWANYYRLTGQIDRCVQSLESAAQINPEHWFSVADLYALDNKPELARRALYAASNAYRLNLGKDPLSVEDRMQLALAQARAGEYQQAAESIRAGLELSPGAKPLLNARSQLEIIRLEQTMNQATNLAQKLEIADEILSKSVDPSATYQKTFELYNQATKTEEQESIVTFLDQALSKYGPNPTLMFSQSVILVSQSRHDQARSKLEAAIELFPEHGLSLNNLAWLLANKDPKNLDKAKTYVQRAIATNPKIATFHDTLGTIYLETGDWRSAVSELEIALAQSPVASRTKIHAKLAKAYDAIGDQKLASLHRERSSQTR